MKIRHIRVVEERYGKKEGQALGAQNKGGDMATEAQELERKPQMSEPTDA